MKPARKRGDDDPGLDMPGASRGVRQFGDGAGERDRPADDHVGEDIVAGEPAAEHREPDEPEKAEPAGRHEFPPRCERWRHDRHRHEQGYRSERPFPRGPAEHENVDGDAGEPEKHRRAGWSAKRKGPVTRCPRDFARRPGETGSPENGWRIRPSASAAAPGRRWRPGARRWHPGPFGAGWAPPARRPHWERPPGSGPAAPARTSACPIRPMRPPATRLASKALKGIEVG